ncbi:MAG: hypothetical protein V4592_26755 [Bacteroidota bacterium]
MRTTFTLLLSVLVFIAKAQTEDYVITTNGDTVRCYVEISNQGTAKYKVPDGKYEKIKIDKIKEYYDQLNDLRFRAVYRDSSKRPEFLRVIENGLISLYMHNNNYYGMIGAITVAPTSMLITKGGDRAVTIKTTSLLNNDTRQQRKDTLAVMFADKPEIYHMYKDDGKFGGGKILNLVHLYNTGKPYTPPVKKPRNPDAKKDDLY